MGGKLGVVAFCLLFAVLFGGVGVGASWTIGKTVHDGMRAKDWVLVKAKVDAFDRGQVSYRYTFQGREYKGDRLGSEILGGTDNIDSWHEEMADMISTAQREGRPITVFVNPDNPSESMVDRAIRWNLMLFMVPFALGFGGVGVGALWFLVHTLRGEPAEPQAKARARVSTGGGGALGLWVFAFFWNAISVPIALLVLPEVIRNEEWIGLLVLLFPLFGVLMIWGAISQTIAVFRRRGMPAEPPPPEPAASVAHGTSTLFARGMIADDPAPAAVVATSAPASSVRSFDAVLEADDPPAAPLAASPAAEGIESLIKLFDKNAKLTPSQRAAFAKLPPEQQQTLAKLANLTKFAPSFRGAIIGFVVLIFALEFLPSLISLFTNR